MKRIRSAWVAAAVLGVFVSAAHAERIHHRAGTSSAPFLKIGAGARPVAMGEAFTALADDVHSVYWNPAGLTGVERPHFTATHQQAYQGLSHEFFGYGQPLLLPSQGTWRRAPYKSAWGASLLILTVPGDLERRGAEETGAMGQITTSQGTFGAADMAFGLSYALQRGRHSFGVTGKLIRQAIDNQTAHGAAMDLGWVGRDMYLKDLSLGAAVLNLGPGIRFTDNWYPLPLTLKAGAAYHVRRARTTVAMDVSQSRDDFMWFSLGGEVDIKDYLYLRTGYRIRWHGNPLGGLSGFRSGLGFHYKDMTLDYAVAPFGSLGTSHMFALGFRFGKAGEEYGAPPAPRAERPAHGAVAGNGEPSQEAPQPEEASAKVETPPAPPPVIELPPPPVQLEASDLLAYRVLARIKSVSERGPDFHFRATAPDEGPGFVQPAVVEVEFRAYLPSASGADVRIGPALSHPPLPEPFEALGVYAVRINVGSARSFYFNLVATEKMTVFGLIDGAWVELPSEPRTIDGRKVLRATSNRMPQAVALGIAR